MSNLNDSYNELPFALQRWIKLQKELEEKHQDYMLRKNTKDDLTYYLPMLRAITEGWKYLNPKEKQIVMNLARWHSESRIFSIAQRSVIANIAAKYKVIS